MLQMMSTILSALELVMFIIGYVSVGYV